ncbi:MAG: hypothetical protein ACE5JU_21890 [Candidatus Binatia bacterium]
MKMKSTGEGSQKPPAREVTSEEVAAYRVTARPRWEREQQERVRQRRRAWEVTRRAARLLKEQFGATHGVVFGSLVHEGALLTGRTWTWRPGRFALKTRSGPWGSCRIWTQTSKSTWWMWGLVALRYGL